MKDIDISLNSLSDTMFWGGYEIWRKRQILVKNFWKNLAPKEWKVGEKKERKSRAKRKLRPNCKNPFHFCEKLSDLSMQLRTVCACSDMKRVSNDKDKCMDIRYFLTKYPKRVSLSDKFLSSSSSTQVPKRFDALVRDDLVRMEHDRKKQRKKQKQIK